MIVIPHQMARVVPSRSGYDPDHDGGCTAIQQPQEYLSIKPTTPNSDEHKFDLRPRR